jgi:hypothetical protein
VTEDYVIFDALQRVGSVFDVEVLEADVKVSGEVVRHDYAIIESGSEGKPVSVITCVRLDDLSLEMAGLVQDALVRMGAWRFIEAIDDGTISAQELAELAGDVEGAWRIELERRLLPAKLPAGAVVGSFKRL